jgi:hypothetical protein
MDVFFAILSLLFVIVACISNIFARDNIYPKSVNGGIVCQPKRKRPEYFSNIQPGTIIAVPPPSDGKDYRVG